MKIKIYPILTLFILLFGGCELKAEPKNTQTEKEYPYVDFKRWSEGRICTELLWKCLPESNDTVRWRKPLENGLDSFELNKETMSKYDRIRRDWKKRYEEYHTKPHKQGEKEPMLISALDKKFVDRVEAKHFLIEMEESLAKEFPGFWRDVPKKVRYRWMHSAMNKAKFFRDRPKLNSYLMVELCARIGLDFDKDPKWEEITKFITFFYKKNYKEGYGLRFTYWFLRNCCPHLGYPKRLFIPNSIKLEKERYRWDNFKRRKGVS